MARHPAILPRLTRSERGATVVEFALVAPLFLMMIFAVFDTGMKVYTTSILHGAMQRVGRDFSLEDAYSNRTALEGFISAQVRQVAPAASVTFTRNAYFDFADIGQAEEYDDLNANGQCDANEPFEDANANGHWDTDRGQAGNGGARDALVFTATVRYRRLMPVGALLGWPRDEVMQASSVLRNQPYDEQNRTVRVANCP